MKKEELFDSHVQYYYCYHDIEVCPQCDTPFAQYESECTNLFGGRAYFCTDACFEKSELEHLSESN